jgi:hypothetical protein
MPGGEQRQFDEQLNDDYSIEVLGYRKSRIITDKMSGIDQTIIVIM